MNRTPAKWLFIALAIVALGAICLWLAGFFYLALGKINPFGLTDFHTWIDHWEQDQSTPILNKRLKMAALLAGLVSYGLPALLVIFAGRQQQTLHGDARFANAGEIQRAGLLGNQGIIIGKWKNRFLLYPGNQFVLLAAPTRSGKGVGVVIPNLLHWPDSVVVLDVKLENFLITSKYRAHCGQEVFLFNPFSITADRDGNPLFGKTHRYNPLGYISTDPNLRVTEILAIGYALYPGDGKDAFFDDAARNLFLGLTLYLCETPGLPCTIGELLRQSSGKGMPVKDYLLNIVHARNYKEVQAKDPQTGATVTQWQELTDSDPKDVPMLSSECVDALHRFTAASDNTLASILATFNVPLTIWASPIVDAATSANDFDLRHLRRKPMSIYLGIPANKLAEAKLLLNLFYTQLINLNTDQLLHATPALRVPCLLLNDEFTAPGRIGIIDKANSYMAGYGLRLLTIIQSPSQLEADAPKGYGRENARTLITNHACQILYTPREQRDANDYSEMLGYYTYKAKSLSRQRGGKNPGGHNESESDQKRALLLPQEFKELSQRRQIINLENTKAIQCDKIHYYDDPRFLQRLREISPRLAALKKNIPGKTELEAIWGAGELASAVPELDLDLHRAVIQARYRAMTLDDVAGGVDLRSIALDTLRIPTPIGGTLAAQQIEEFVNGFFDALDAAGSAYELESINHGSGSRPSSAELAAMTLQAELDEPDNAGWPMNSPTAPSSAAVRTIQPEKPILDLSHLGAINVDAY